MPYVESNEELIPLLMLLSLAFAAPAASIMIGEGVLYCIQSKLKGRGSSEGSINAGGCNFNSFLRRTVRFVGVHVFGLCATALVTDVIQLATGYHAPFFLTVCKPNYTRLGTSCASNPYITQDICTGNDQQAILSARKTFPSQHATLSAFAAVYVSMYFNSIISDSTKLLKPLLVFAFSIAAGVCGLTQITQYRSHPVDVYAGFLIGAGIAAYLAYHAVGNFQASCEDSSSPTTTTKDPLRALTQRGHESVYHQNKSSSTDELTPRPRSQSTQRQVQREKNSLGSLKRASVDVDLLAPRSPMGKENMVTFSNTLPRVSTPSMEDPARRHMTIHVPAEGSRPRGTGPEWKPKPLEGRSLTLGEEVALAQAHRRAASETSGIALDDVDPDRAPPSLYPTVQARTGAPRVLIQPRPAAPPLLHIPEENPTGSPKGSSAIRAKWMMMAEKGGPPRAAANAPRLMQVIALSKQQQQQTALGSSTPKHSETSSSSTTSSSDSSQYRSPSDRDSSSIVTIDAHAPHHPVVHLSSGNGPWEWKAGPKSSEALEGGTYELGKEYRGYRTPKGAGVSPGSSISDLEPDPEPRYGPTVNVAGGVPTPLVGEGISASRDSSLRRKPQIAEREGSEESEEPFYKKLQNQRFKD
ncbi:phospholipid phosphatase-related protein type 3 isoform X2 [Pelobates fuscus]